MKKLKVCHIITMLELGGAQRNTLFTLGKLDRDKFIPVLICGRGGMLDAETAAIPGLTTYFVPSLIRTINPLKDLISVFQILRLLRREKPDVVHTHSSKAGILGRLAARLAGVPVVVHTYHGFGFNDFQKALPRTAFVLAEKAVAPMTTRFIAVANEDIAKGVSHGIGSRERYTLIRSGIDISKYAAARNEKASSRTLLGIAPGKSVVTTIGPFKPQKNLTDFVKASALVLKDVPDSCFLIVGDGSQRQLIEQLIGGLGLSSDIKLLGWRKDIEKVLAATDVFVMTSLWEGLPRSILEAMSSRLPVVANSVDGVKEVISDGKTGYLVEPRDIKTLSNRIVSLLRNPAAAKEMGVTGAQFIDRQYDINYMVDQQEALYTELSEKHGHN